jgi:uncharacterized protein (DUF58 family)
MNVRRTLLLGVAALGVAALLRSEAMAFAAMVVVLLAGLAWYTGRRILDRVEYSRSLSRPVVSWGGEVELSIAVANRKWLPLMWLRVQDDWPSAVQPLGFTLDASHKARTSVLTQALSVRWYQRVRRRYPALCVERGVHSFGPARLQGGDPFGLTTNLREIETRDEVVVLPKILRLPPAAMAHGRPLAGAPSRTSLMRDPSSLIGIRPYRAGDPLKAINWRATARTSGLQTNEFEPCAEAEVLILLNLRVFGSPWQRTDPELIELLCVLAASAATALSEEDFAVGLRSNGLVPNQRDPLSIDPAPGALPEILDGLARLILSAASPFEQTLQAELQARVRPAEYLVVTSSLDGGITPLLLALRQERPTSVTLVGDPCDTDESGELVDWRVPRDFDWRRNDALAMA